MRLILIATTLLLAACGNPAEHKALKQSRDAAVLANGDEPAKKPE